MDEPTAVDPADPPAAPEGPDRTRAPGRRRVWWLVGAGALVALVAVLVVFQPQKLFIDTEVNESLAGLVDDTAPSSTVAPGQSPNAQSPNAQSAAPAGPVVVSRGSFVSVEHPTSGQALLVRQPDGSYLVRFEGLDTDNGPDLKVALSTKAVGSRDYGNLTLLGSLKGNKGDQNYVIPAGTDLSGLAAVVVWCERFSVAFGEAPLSPPPVNAAEDAMADPADAMAAPVGVGPTPYGPALVDAEGRPFYTWDNEPAGTIACTGTCAEKWPPLLLDAVPTDLPDGLDASRVGLVTRPDGTMQLTIDGRALYRMAIDEPGEANCQGGDGWHILHPDGTSNRSTTPG